MIKSSSRELKLNLKYLTSLNRYDKHLKNQAIDYIHNSFQTFNLKTLKHKFQMPLSEVTNKQWNLF